MGLFDFFNKMQESVDKYSNPEYLKLDTEIATRVKKRLTSLEGTVKDMKAHDAKLQQEYQQAEAIKYGREEKPSYSGKGFEAFLESSTKFSEEKAQAKTLEQVRSELAEFKRFKEPFLKGKLKEIDDDMQVLKKQQTAKLREVENVLETVYNTDEINALYAEIVTEYHSLVQRFSVIARYCPYYYYEIPYERIEPVSYTHLTLPTIRLV